MKDDPKAHQWIVAHSHGGNVALRAMAAVNESVPHRTQISTIALATPFTHSRGRVIQLNQAAMTALFGILLILMGWASLTTEHKTVIDWMQIVAASLFLLILTLCLVGLIMHRDKVGPGFRDRLVSSIHAPPSDVDRILVMRSAGDEASTLLAAGQFVGWLTGITSRLLGSFRLWGLIIISTQISIFVAVLLHTRRLAFMQYVFALPGLTLVVLVTLLLGSSLVFGADGPFVSLFVFTSIEASPPGGAVLLQLEPFASEGRRLAHSRLYDDERVIKQIVEVIQGSSRLARRRTTSS